MSKQEIGPREQQVRALREAKFEKARSAEKLDVEALRKKVSDIPARKLRAAKKKRA